MLLLRKRRRAIAAEVHARLGEGIVAAEESANFFGVESRGKLQIRGNGFLAASSSQILFIMWLPRRELTILRNRVSAVERTMSHLGKTIGRQLLRVRFTNDAGQQDSVAWFVRDLQAWESALGTVGDEAER
ncbi:MAG TPA: hypothetical protein VG408_04095 [Actinomycetota bacterium]|nr:hypothetical protein [Actinomycetota bacterium]